MSVKRLWTGLFPGILGMNMMSSAPMGGGVRCGPLPQKRGAQTPAGHTLTAVEHLSAQLLSRLFVLMFSLVLVWIGCDSIFSSTVRGSYLDLRLVFMIGGLSLSAFNTVLSTRLFSWHRQQAIEKRA